MPKTKSKSSELAHIIDETAILLADLKLFLIKVTEDMELAKQMRKMRPLVDELKETLNPNPKITQTAILLETKEEPSSEPPNEPSASVLEHINNGVDSIEPLSKTVKRSRKKNTPATE